MAPGYVAILAALLGVATAFDVLERRVPNAVSALVATIGLVAQASAGGSAGAFWGTAGGALMLAALLVPWGFGKLGGGDVKLAAATAIWMGTDRLVWFALLTGAAGLPVAIATRLVHRAAQWRMARWRIAQAGGELAAPAGRETVPVAAAIAIGALAALCRGVT